MRSVAGALVLSVAVVSSTIAHADPSPMLRVRALGCFFEIPANYTLIADLGDRLEFIAPGAAGAVEIVPQPEAYPRLRKVSSTTAGHLAILELTDDDVREPMRLTVIQNGVQAVTLWRAARDLREAIVASCLANIHPEASGAPRAPAEERAPD